MKVVLRSDAWHAKLQRWTFGDVKLRPNLCPYFWLTVFCVVVSPIVLLYRFIKLLFRGLGFCVEKVAAALAYVWNKIEDRALSSEVVKLGLEGAYRMWVALEEYERSLESFSSIHRNFLWYNDELRKQYREHLTRFQQLNPNWKELFEAEKVRLEEARKRWYEAIEAEKARALERTRRRERILNKIASGTRWVFKGIAYIIAIAAIGGGLSGIGLAIYELIVGWHLIDWLLVGKIAGGIVVASLALAGLIAVIKSIVERRRSVPKKVKPDEPGLISLYFKAAKENYCPSIDWDPITRSDHPNDR